MTRRILWMLCAGMLAGSLMTGCGTQDMPAAETEISDQIAEETVPPETTAETTSAETAADTETTLAETTSADITSAETVTETSASDADAAPEDDLAAAQHVLEQYIESVRTGDADTMLETSNAELIWLIFGGAALSEENQDEWHEALREGLSETAVPDLTYAIGAGRADAEMLAEYNEDVQQSLTEFRNEDYADGEYSDAAFARIEAFMQPIDGLCVFPVTMTEDGEDVTENLYVIRLSGKWTVDLIFAESLEWKDFEGP